MGPGERAIWRAAVHFRDAGFFGHWAAHCRSAQHRQRGVSDRTGAALVAATVDHLHRAAGRRAERHSRTLGHFRHGALAPRTLVPLAEERAGLSAPVPGPDLRRE